MSTIPDRTLSRHYFPGLFHFLPLFHFIPDGNIEGWLLHFVAGCAAI